MPDKPVINIMAQDAPPGKEEQYNEWTNKHLDALFKFKGIKKAERYKRIGTDEKVPQYIGIYYFDSFKDFEAYNKSPELAAAIKTEGRPEGIVVKWRAQFELIKSWEKK